MYQLSSTQITKQNILNAFWKLYATGGMRQVSVTKICKLANYNRSTFYAYFQDIFQVLDTIESHIISPEAFEKNIFLPLLTCQDQTALLNGLIHFFELHDPYLPILLSEYGDSHFRHKLLENLKPILYKNLPHTSYSNDQLNYIFEFQSSAVLSTISKWYKNGKDIPQEELIHILLQLTSHGIKNTLLYDNYPN